MCKRLACHDTHVAHERVERPERRPSCAERLRRVLREPAHVRADHGHLEDAGEREDARDGLSVVRPLAQVVPKPFAHLSSCSRERRARDHDGALTGAARAEREVRRGRHHRSIQIVRVVLDETIRVERFDLGPGEEMLALEYPMSILDRIRSRCHSTKDHPSWRSRMGGIGGYSARDRHACAREADPERRR